MSKTIRLLATAIIAGFPRSPVEGLQIVSDEDAKRLIDAGQAEEAEDQVEGTAAAGVAGAFDATAFVGRNLDEITDADLAALTPEQRTAVREAETGGKNRATFLSRLDAADQAAQPAT
jgi:hypothetical protein